MAERVNADHGLVDAWTANLGGPRTAALLDRLDTAVAWATLVRPIAALPEYRGPARGESNKGGRPAWPALTMLKCALLAKWFGLSDPQLEECLQDRLSFRRFVGLAVVRRDDALLRYYDGIKCPFLCPVGVENLIATTNAQCSGFTNLLVGAMQVQGAVVSMDGTPAPEWWKIYADENLFLIDPTSFQPGLFFLIADYMFVEPGTSGVPAYPYKGNHPCVGVNTRPEVMNWPNNEAVDVAGVPAQGSPDPASVFGSHFVVKFNNQYWGDL